MIRNTVLLSFATIMAFCLSGQDSLSVEQAVFTAVENNFQIKLSQKNRELSELNTSIYNKGQLPTVSLSGGANLNIDNTTANFQDGRSTTITGAYSDAVNASVDVGYTLFDKTRKWNSDILDGQFELSEIEKQLVIENVIAQTISAYYSASEAQNNINIIRESISVSNERLNRLEEEFKYGQNTKLAILNAQVDLNNDSLSLLSAQLVFDNNVRLLNNLMAVNLDTHYILTSQADTDRQLQKDIIRDLTLNSNRNLILADKVIEIGQLSIDLAKARKLPVLGLNASYGYALSNNNAASFLSSLNSHGLTAGISIRQNIFDGGSTKMAEQNARLNQIISSLEKEQLKADVLFDFENAWANYQNARDIYNKELSNLNITEQNFIRTNERFNAGQINSVEFRQAQINLINTRARINNLAFGIHQAETQLLLISGSLLD